MATLPPTLLSTWEIIVVGIWMKGTPRKKVAAAKPPRSPVTPPPKVKIQSLRVMPASESCCQSKADIVEHDVFDMGERMMLNFGHTIGHAIEGCYGFGHYTHGEGVAAGMSMLTGVTEAMGLTKAGTTARLRKVIKQYGLPTDVDASAEDLIPYISNDKKMRGNHITLVIIEEIGKARLLPLAAEDLPKYIRKKDA